MTRTLATLLALALTLTTSGCATIFKGSHSSISVTSTPSGADVFFAGARVGTTPCELSVASAHDIHLQLYKSGYRPATYLLESTTDVGWVALDIVAPPVLAGLAVLGVAATPPPDDGQFIRGDVLFALISGAFLGLIAEVVLPVVDGRTGNWRSPADLNATLKPDSLAEAKP